MLTAAHCRQVPYELSDMYLVAGQHSFSETTGDEEFVPIAEFASHREYDSVTFENDIALIRARREFTLGTNIKPVCLPERGDFAYQKGVVSGWGSQITGKNTGG